MNVRFESGVIVEAVNHGLYWAWMTHRIILLSVMMIDCQQRGAVTLTPPSTILVCRSDQAFIDYRRWLVTEVMADPDQYYIPPSTSIVISSYRFLLYRTSLERSATTPVTNPRTCKGLLL